MAFIHAEGNTGAEKSFSDTGLAIRTASPQERAAVIPVYPELLERADLQLDLASVLHCQLGSLEATNPIAYRYAASQQELLEPPVSDVNDLRCIVAIPVAAHQEQRFIYDLLGQYAKQLMDPGQFEVLLHLNFTSTGDADEDAERLRGCQETYAEIERAKSTWPHLAIRTMSGMYVGDSTIGMIRSDQWNTIAMDMAARGRQEDILVISNDADTCYLHPGYLSGLSELFESSSADVVVSRVRLQPVPGLPSTAYANRILRYKAFIDNVRDNYDKVIRTPDYNTGISLATYMAAGGIDELSNIAEVKLLTERITALRGELSQRAVIERHRDAYMVYNSRRLIGAMALGFMPFDAWFPEALPFKIEDEVRCPSQSPSLKHAEEHAQANAKEWADQITERFLGSVPVQTRERLRDGAYKILDLV